VTYRATITTPAAPARVRQTLTDVRTLAAWNPAIGPLVTDDRTAVVGVEYRTRVRGFVPASMVFDTIDESRIEYRMRALASEERGSWSWRSTAAGTEIAHEFTHQGVLFTLMGGAFDEVPRWRLERLRDVLTRPAEPPRR
jgi:uncharacterized protein YndB with AHSA1/START domain